MSSSEGIKVLPHELHEFLSTKFRVHVVTFTPLYNINISIMVEDTTKYCYSFWKCWTLTFMENLSIAKLQRLHRWLFGMNNTMMSSNGNMFRVNGPLCGEFTGEFPAQRAVTRSFDVSFDLRLNKRWGKQSWGWD